VYYFATLAWPENPADAISEVLNSKISSAYNVALPVPEQLPYSGYAIATIVYPNPHMYATIKEARQALSQAVKTCTQLCMLQCAILFFIITA